MSNITNPNSINNRQEAQRQFVQAIESHRLKLSGPLIPDGEWHRCDAVNKSGNSGKNDGVYVLHLDGVPRGAFINYTTDNGQVSTWVFKPDRPFTDIERRELDERIKADMAEARAKLVEARDHAQAKAKRIWSRAEDASAEHPYAVAKKIKPHRLGYRNEKLWVPMLNEQGDLQNLQSIDADGNKRFLKGGSVRGCHFWVAKPKETDSDSIGICEGWATGESIYQATKYAVCVAFNAGNLKAVGEWVRKKYPDHQIIICADDDHKTDGNPGLTAAQEAALEVDGLLAVPEFDKERADGDTDFNDMANSIGLKAVKAAIDAAAAPEDDEDEDDDDDDGHQATQADALIALASNAELFHDDATGYADIEVDGHRESWPIRSGGFRDWLLHRYFRANHTAPSEGAMRLAVGTLGAKARFEGQKHEVFVRVGGYQGKVYLDLCDPSWQVIEIDAKGWRVVSKPPVRFRRAPGMLHLPVPVKGGAVEDLRPFVNVAGDADFILLVAWLLAAYRDCGPYPGLALKGDEGSAKSTLGRILRQLVDPSKVKERRLPREDRDLHIHASKSYMLSFGNVSALPDWLSDSLCALATGGGFATRALYTDDDEILFSAMRPVVLNGIEFVTRSDLADRLIFLKLPAIKEASRRTEQELWAEFEAKRPQILGALLDVVVHGLRELPNTPIEPYPRMADFAHWVTACEGALWARGDFKAAYEDNRAATTLDVLESDPIAGAVRLLMEKMAMFNEAWTGTATELLDELQIIVGEKESKRKHWPGSAAVLGQRLRRIKTRLERSGIHVDFEADAKTRSITIKQDPKNAVPAVPAVISKRSQRDGKDRTADDTDGDAVSPAVSKKPLGHKHKDSRDSKDSRMHTLFHKGAAKSKAKFKYQLNTEARERRVRRILGMRNQ